ncbi:unnamed protein product [Urochloa humidicola]
MNRAAAFALLRSLSCPFFETSTVSTVDLGHGALLNVPVHVVLVPIYWIVCMNTPAPMNSIMAGYSATPPNHSGRLDDDEMARYLPPPIQCSPCIDGNGHSVQPFGPL